VEEKYELTWFIHDSRRLLRNERHGGDGSIRFVVTLCATRHDTGRKTTRGNAFLLAFLEPTND